MGSNANDPTPAHVVLVPFPAQGHVAPLMQLARLLHARGARITFVYTQFHYARLLQAKGEAAVKGSSPSSFRVEVIDDGLSLSVMRRGAAGIVDTLRRNCPDPFRALLRRLEQEEAGVTCVVCDVVQSFAAAAARDAGIPDVQLFTASACGLLAYAQYGELVKRGIVPFKDASFLADDHGYLDTPLEWAPGMAHMRLRDLPPFCRTTDPDDFMVSETIHHMESAAGAKALVINTLYELEKDVVDALAAVFPPPIYTVGPLAEVIAASGDDDSSAMDISFWQEDTRCLSWLDGKPDGSVVYVNFGSIAVMTAAQVREFALGLATCGSPFLWVKRPDVVDGEEVELPEVLLDAVARGGGLVVPWCPQPAVLKHAAVGLFVTHCGWNSLLEATAAGQPLLAWPSLAEQATNCRQVCQVWGNGTELPREVDSGAVARFVREMMAGDLGKEKRAKAAEWKAVAEAAVSKGGASWRAVNDLLNQLLSK